MNNKEEYERYYKSRYGEPEKQAEQMPGWIVLIPLFLAILFIILYYYSG